VLALLVLLCAPLTDAMAQSLDLEGNAISLGGGCYRLTFAQNSQRGAVWYAGTVDISESWEMNAQVYLGTNNGGADGMTFVLRDPDAPALGGGGSLMGYGGNATSAAIEPSVLSKLTRMPVAPIPPARATHGLIIWRFTATAICRICRQTPWRDPSLPHRRQTTSKTGRSIIYV